MWDGTGFLPDPVPCRTRETDSRLASKSLRLIKEMITQGLVLNENGRGGNPLPVVRIKKKVNN